MNPNDCDTRAMLCWGSRCSPQPTALDLPAERAVEAMSAEPNGPAYRAGVHTGDFILALNGQAVRYVDDLHRGFSESPFGEPVRLELL